MIPPDTSIEKINTAKQRKKDRKKKEREKKRKREREKERKRERERKILLPYFIPGPGHLYIYHQSHYTLPITARFIAHY